MKLDKGTLSRLGVSCGVYNREARTTLARAQYDHSRAARAMTNHTPVRRELAGIVAHYMQQVESGELTMEEAARFINELPGETPKPKPEIEQPVPKPKKTKKRKKKAKINNSLREQLSQIKLDK